MKYLILLFIGLLSVSCLTVKRIEKNCDKFAKVCITETETETDTTKNTETKIEYRDTTIIVYVMGESVEDKKPVVVVDENKKPIPVKKEYVNSALSVLAVPFARSYAKVVNSELKHELVQTDTLLRIRLENALVEKKILETQITSLKQVQTVPIKENTKFAKFTIKWFFVSIVLIILTGGFFIIRFKSKIVGLFK